MADTPFDWLIGNATQKAAGQLEGRLEQEFLSPFSVPVMDAGFKFNELVIAETQKFIYEVLEVEMPLHRIVVFSTLNILLQREQSYSKAESKLFLIRAKDGKLSALLYMGCSIEEPKATTTISQI